MSESLFLIWCLLTASLPEAPNYQTSKFKGLTT